MAAALPCDTSKPDSAARSGSARLSPVAMASRESSVVAPASEPVIAVPIDTASVADSSAESASAELEEWIRQLVRGGDTSVTLRSEEHTSELQSLTNLVCRLLLEKKKKSKVR